jgi:hypothetical protein
MSNAPIMKHGQMHNIARAGAPKKTTVPAITPGMRSRTSGVAR